MTPFLLTLFSAAKIGDPGDVCNLDGGGFLGFPHWYKYLWGSVDPGGTRCMPVLHGLSDVWLIVAAVIEILLRVAAILAVAMIIYAGFGFVTSQGEPDKAAQARTTAINALIGLGIAIMATFIITFIAGSIHN